MKNNSRLFGIISVFAIITFVCIACEQQPDNEEDFKIEIWNGIKFRQNIGVTDNQYEITVNKFKAVFNSDAFTDEERVKLKNYTNSVHIWPVGGGSGWQADSGNNKIDELAVPCDSIQYDIEELLRRVLEDIDKYFIG